MQTEVIFIGCKARETVKERLAWLPEPTSESSQVSITELWLKEFRYYGIKESSFIPAPTVSTIPITHTGYCVFRTAKKQFHFPELYVIYLSPNTDTLVSRQWLDKHWADLEDYKPEVYLSWGIGYTQTFTLKQPELLRKIIEANSGKKFLKALRVKPS